MTKTTMTREHAFPLDGPINLTVRFGHGSVHVQATDDCTEALVRLTARRPDNEVLDRIAVELRGPNLAVVAPRQGGLSDVFGGFQRDRDAVDAEITVPSGTAMNLVTASADLTVTGRSGSADVVAGSADVDIDTVDGELLLRTGSANVRVHVVTGDVVSRSGSGNVSLGETGGTVQAGSGSGDLRIETAHGPVRSKTGSGDARIECAFGDIDRTAGSGRLRVGLPKGVSARVDVKTGSGRVRSDLPIEDAPASSTEITVRARTGSGDIELHRAGQAA
jgi:hypothetical protein